MVSTITESFFLQNFESWGNEKLQTCQWLQLWAANGLDIPYIGYFELDVEVLNKLIPGRGVMVVKDPPSPLFYAKDLRYPGDEHNSGMPMKSFLVNMAPPYSTPHLLGQANVL